MTDDCKTTLTEIQRRLTDDLAYVDGALAALEEPAGTGETAVMADTLMRRVAINCHLNWRSTVWGQGGWKPYYSELGIRFCRTKIGVSQPAMNDLKSIDAKGICLIGDKQYNKTEAQRDLDFLSPNAQWVNAIEGPNEPNSDHAPSWAMNLKDFCTWLYARVEADDNLRIKNVVGPSIWKRITADYQALGDISTSLDIGNLHYYTGGNKPTETSVGDDSGMATTLDQAITDARIVCGDKPLWITETGWQVDGAGAPLNPGICTPLAQAKYIPRMICEGYNRGVMRHAIYSLLDDDNQPPHYHGLMTQALVKRPAFDALKRVLKFYDDPGDDFEPGLLEYTMVGAGVQRLPLMQRRDGTFVITLWQDAVSYNQKTFKDVNPAPKPVTIDLGTPMSFRVSQPTLSAEVSESAGNSITVQVPDHLMVVEIS